MKEHVYVFNPTPVFGGAEVFLIRLAELLQIQSRFVVASPEAPALQNGVEKAGGRFVRLDGSGGIAFRLSFLAWLWRHRATLRTTAAAFVLNGRGAAYFAPFVRLVTGMRPVVVCHTELTPRDAGPKIVLYGAALRFTRWAVAVSDTVEAQHRTRWPALRLRAIPNWIEGARAASPAQPARAAARRMDIAVVGRLADNKGILELAGVFASMQGVEAHFYGEGPLQEQLGRMASATPSLHVHGHVADLPSRLPRHTVLVSGSYSESFSYSVAEGIHAGLLCVVSAIPAHRELLGPDYPQALYFIPGDAAGLRRALESAARLLNDADGAPARQAIGAAHARMRVRNGPEKARTAYRSVLFD